MRARNEFRDYGPFPATVIERGISKTVAYELVGEGLLETFKIGRKRYVYLDSVGDLPKKLQRRQAAAEAHQ